MKNNRKGYRVERNIRLLFERYGWGVVRSGGSLGLYDLIAFKNRKALFIQVKSTKNRILYYYGYTGKRMYGFPFVLVVDFGRGKRIITSPKRKVRIEDGKDLLEFLKSSRNGFQ